MIQKTKKDIRTCEETYQTDHLGKIKKLVVKKREKSITKKRK